MLKGFWVMILFLFTRISSLEIQTDICRITYDQTGAQSINIVLCQQIDECISGGEGTDEQCGQYSYTSLTNQQCVTVCCPQMTVTVLSTTSQVLLCEQQYITRRVIYISTIVGSILLIAGVFIGIGLTCLYGYQTNPYTSERVYVGCLCCKKVPQFKRSSKAKDQGSQKQVNEQYES